MLYTVTLVVEAADNLSEQMVARLCYGAVNLNKGEVIALQSDATAHKGGN